MDLIALARKLVDIPSLTGEEEQVGRFIASYLQSLGYNIEMQEVGATRYNVIATTEAAPETAPEAEPVAVAAGEGAATEGSDANG